MNNFYKKMREKINRYSNEEYLDGYIHDEFLTDDGDADIFLNIENKNELFDKRTVGKQLALKDDVYKYIEDKSSMLNNDIQIHFHILGLELSPHEKEGVKHIVKEHFAIELYKIQKEYVECRNKIVFLLLFGILSFLLYTVFYFFLDFNFFLEVFVFLFTFSLWEAFDSLIYALSRLKNERDAISQNLLMNVTFNEKDI